MSILATAALAFGVSLIAAPAVLSLLRRTGVVDVPSSRSMHLASTPRGGGVATALGCIVAAVASSDLRGDNRVAILSIACGMGLLGLVDDLHTLDWFRSLLAQVTVATVGLLWLGQNITGPILWRIVFSLGLVLWVVGYVNAFNFMDGINGISVAQVVGAGVLWWAVGQTQRVPALAIGGLITSAAGAAFAPFNVPRATMFLGDVGSYFLGAWLAVTAVIGLRAGVTPEAILAPLAIYGADTSATLLRRLRRGERFSEPHREHTYQQLVQAGWSHARTSLVVALAIVASGALGALSLNRAIAIRAIGDVSVLAVLGTYLALPHMLTRHRTPR